MNYLVLFDFINYVLSIILILGDYKPTGMKNMIIQLKQLRFILYNMYDLKFDR